MTPERSRPLVDDLLATGGTARAAVDLVQYLRAEARPAFARHRPCARRQREPGAWRPRCARRFRRTPRLGDLLELTRELGTRHVGYGVRVSHYAIVGDALFAALGAVLGDHFDAATRDAWSVGYNLVAGAMLERQQQHES
jgi:hypothetical protein